MTGYAIKDEKGIVRPSTFNTHKDVCISKFLARGYYGWEAFKGWGWKCVEVKLVEV